MLDVERTRDLFPTTRRIAYFRNNTMGLMPSTVRAALGEYLDTWEAGGAKAWDTWVPLVEEAANELGGLLGAPAGSVMMHQNTTALMWMVLSALDAEPGRNRVVYTDLEFPTIHYVAQRHGGLEPVIVRSPDRIRVEPEAIAEAIDERTRIAMLCQTYFCSGYVLDLRPIVEKARKVGALVLADVFQSAGAIPVNVTELGVDFAVTGSHKFLCGGSGAAGLYVRPELLAKLRPRLTGWLSHARPMEMEFGVFEDAPDMNRFMGGTPSIAALYQARCGWRAIAQAGVENIHAHSLALQERILAAADELGMKVYSPRDPARRGGQVHLSFGSLEKDLAARDALYREEIAIDCRGAFNGLRIAPHLYNTADEVARLTDALRRFARAA